MSFSVEGETNIASGRMCSEGPSKGWPMRIAESFESRGFARCGLEEHGHRHPAARQCKVKGWLCV